MASVAIAASPFRCRWIQKGSEMRVNSWSFALCTRLRDRVRIVSEEECRRCPFWQEGTDRHFA
jgi:hypothetical protein